MFNARTILVGMGMMGSPAWAGTTAPLGGADTTAVAVAPTQPEPVRLAFADCSSCHEGESTQSFVPFDIAQFQVDMPSRTGWRNTLAMPQALDLPEPAPVATSAHQLTPVVVADAEQKFPLPFLLVALALGGISLVVGGVRYWNGLEREWKEWEAGENDDIDPQDLELLEDDTVQLTGRKTERYRMKGAAVIQDGSIGGKISLTHPRAVPVQGIAINGVIVQPLIPPVHSLHRSTP